MHVAFQGQLKAHQTPQKTKCFTHSKPLLQAICVSGYYMEKKKRKRFPGPPPCKATVVYVTITYPHPSWGMLAPLPFEARSKACMHRLVLQFRID